MTLVGEILPVGIVLPALSPVLFGGVAQARAQELEPIDDDAAAPTCWFCGLGGGAEASDAAPDASVTILDALGFRSDEASAAAASWTTDSWFSASGAVPPPK